MQILRRLPVAAARQPAGPGEMMFSISALSLALRNPRHPPQQGRRPKSGVGKDFPGPSLLYPRIPLLSKKWAM